MILQLLVLHLLTLVYLYICNYAESNSDISIMSINTLLKDRCVVFFEKGGGVLDSWPNTPQHSNSPQHTTNTLNSLPTPHTHSADDNPMIRGLALRSICSLRLANITEYVMAPIQKGLNDHSAYVRKTAVTGCIKVFYMSPTTVLNSGLVDQLERMLTDKDPQVVTNVISALNEIQAEEGGIKVTKAVVHHLLNRIADFSEWSQCSLLDITVKYAPMIEDEDEIFDIMNLLESRLSHSNMAVVLGTAKAFLQLTADMADVQTDVYERLKAPLLTLMSSGGHELSYTCLCHVKVLVQRTPLLFAQEYKAFFCRFTDPSYVKLVKLDILTVIATENNMYNIVEELSEYVSENVEIARRAIQSIGKIANRLAGGVEAIVQQLLSFLSLEIDYVSAESVLVMKDILRKYPECYAEVLPTLNDCLKTIDEPEAKAAMLWMLGEYGEFLNDAPYLLEPFIDGFEEEISPSVRLALLTASMKLFFKRPPEMKAMLGRLLLAATEDFGNNDVHDRALLYYRLLAADVDEAARVVLCKKDLIDRFTEEQESETADRIFEEFNTLSVVYGMPSERFIIKASLEETIRQRENVMREQAAEAQGQEIDEDAPLIHGEGEDVPASPQSSAGGAVGDLLGGSGFGGAAAPAAAAPAAAPQLKLFANPTVDPGNFQSKWGTSPNAEVINFQLGVPDSALEALLARRHIKCLASGNVAGQIKSYFFALEGETTCLLMCEMLITVASRAVQLTVKCDQPQYVKQFAELVKSVASPM